MLDSEVWEGRDLRRPHLKPIFFQADSSVLPLGLESKESSESDVGGVIGGVMGSPVEVGESAVLMLSSVYESSFASALLVVDEVYAEPRPRLRARARCEGCDGRRGPE